MIIEYQYLTIIDKIKIVFIAVYRLLPFIIDICSDKTVKKDRPYRWLRLEATIISNGKKLYFVL